MRLKLYILISFVLADLLLADLLAAGTYIYQGTISGAIWTSENSPYIIKGNITVADLRIRAGVEVLFDSAYTFNVSGLLQAEGFYSDSVIFKPGSSNTAGWPGINFKLNSSAASYLRYCRIEGASNQGILIEQCTPVISNCNIVHNNGNGIRINRATIEIKHCMTSHNTENGIYLANAQISISNSIISDNTQKGIYSSNVNDVLALQNVVIGNNFDFGISCQRGTASVINSIIYNNNGQIDTTFNHPAVSYSDVQGLGVYPGTGNINSIPGFNNLDLYTLPLQSPCVDAGNPDAAYDDKYFPPSLKGQDNDMGAYGGPAACGWYPPLYVKPQSVYFGQAAADSTVSKPVNILNYRSTGISVSEILFEGDTAQVFSADQQTFFIPYADSLKLNLSFQPERKSLYQADLILRTSAHGDVHIPLDGEGIAPEMNVLLPEIDFGKVALGNSGSVLLPILNAGNDILRLNIELPADSIFAISKSSLLIAPGLSDSIEITFTPALPEIYQDSLILLSNDPQKRHTAVPVRGEGTSPAIYTDPQLLDFGNVPLQVDSLLILVIGNSGNGLLVIDSIKIEGQDPDSICFEITDPPAEFSTTVKPDSILTLLISFSPVRTGLSTAQLVIRSNDPSRNRLTVDLRGTSTRAAISLSSTVLDFGNVSFQSDSLLELVIGNSGHDLLIIDSLKITGQPADSICFKFTDLPAEYSTTLMPDSILTVQIGFTPIKTGLSTAQVVIRSNDPLQSRLTVDLRGNGTVAEINLSAAELDFGNVVLYSDSTLNLVIGNSGDELLVIDSVWFGGWDWDNFRLIGQPEYIRKSIKPDSSWILPVGFFPIRAGLLEGDLIIHSNDPFNNMVIVKLRGNGLAPKIALSVGQLDFGQVFLGCDSTKTLYIRNLGQAELFIPYNGLSISGMKASSYSVENDPEDIMVLPGDSAALSINFHPQEQFGNPAQLTIRSNDPADSILTLILSGVGYNPNPFTISFNAQNSSNPFTGGQAAIIGFTITGYYFPDSAFVYIRSGGSMIYTPVPLIAQGGNEWSAQLDAGRISERGLEYYVQAHHELVSTLYPAGGRDNPAAIQVAVPQLQFPWSTKKETYQMISIPLATSDQDLKTLFEDELGAYDNTQYRIYELTDSAQYTEIPDMDKPLPPGRAVWLITKEARDLVVSDAQSVSTNEKFELQLQQGWNLIATPFAFPLDWEQVSTDIALRYYDGSDWPFASSLEPFKGYAVHVPNDTMLLLPAQAAASTGKLPEKLYKPPGDGWRIQIMAESAGANDRYNYAGVLTQASSGIDAYDHPEPPPIGSFISLYLLPPDVDRKYSTDYRQPGTDLYNYEFEVDANIEQLAKISFRPENLPAEYDWIVVSEEQDLYYPQEGFQITSPQNHFKMIVGAEKYIAQVRLDFRPWSLTYQLGQNYPNPFNPATTIRFSIPEPAAVTVAIFNILGQRINTLLAGIKMEAGIHQLAWDGTNAAGGRVSSGIYILHLSAGKYSRSIKMILCR